MVGGAEQVKISSKNFLVFHHASAHLSSIFRPLLRLNLRAVDCSVLVSFRSSRLGILMKLGKRRPHTKKRSVILEEAGGAVV